MNIQAYKPYISVVTPVYGCEKCLRELYQRLKRVLNQISNRFEIIMVCDHSPDQSWEVIQSLAAHDMRVKGIKLSRNFGQHIAITAGLDASKGDWVVVMDCDLQDQPEEIIHLHTKALEGYDIVFGRRAERHDTLIKKWQSKLFYKVYGYFADTKFDHSIANFSICSRQVVNEVVRLRERSRSYPLFLKWLGFNWTSVDINHAKRETGKSSYNLSKLMRFAMDSIVSQSNKPLRLAIKLGFAISFGSLLFGCFLIYKYFFLMQPVAGWTSFMVSIYFIGGLILANLGVLGLYIGKVFDEVKGRPLYIIHQAVGFEEPVQVIKNKETDV
ncbi:glycosyltransferase family 2 protein [Scopulibacillus cellulosilyticus]|uniref:Glycosyltransferase family 2 protein n=1 Tax=Scopulibacillus cellulosilyticus TaxID=2665665 RepID=A0ABW2Q2R6_9BACL